MEAEGILQQFFRHTSDCVTINKSQKFKTELVDACIKSTFCPVEADIVRDCYLNKDASPARCFAQDARLAQCFNSLVNDSSKLNESTSTKLAYYTTVINKASY
ncbi:hypothetical protein PPL_02346 [Heterostelium album PN500]|uniref:Uncharacterized protein n=1 Tax=Heterostelium pallidum (strain ATCC 26659 / Pp 5 / PN500) TaxID=670386 RepID=D3B219_HETP5|nr:hypothetical protein PPL_02346 [Heterostelium album PN500]EFA85343.1 hypothetical protein PPL_02346 [Heterostelium album PN500]|eukprot:XP_020437452.1 hypothetical protein PPL_02346 [Heterostelium album PN500]